MGKFNGKDNGWNFMGKIMGKFYGKDNGENVKMLPLTLHFEMFYNI